MFYEKLLIVMCGFGAVSVVVGLFALRWAQDRRGAVGSVVGGAVIVAATVLVLSMGGGTLR
ncbi:hypothetical protein KXR83_25725 [Williamsia muralis]|uniref:hypothetical protein n=1 Tax=Williamsia marianensis TaxID=85044 RepID=UPI003F190054